MWCAILNVTHNYWTTLYFSSMITLYILFWGSGMDLTGEHKVLQSHGVLQQMSALGLTLWTLNDWCGRLTAEEPNLLSILVHNYYPTMCAPSCVCVHSDMSVAFLTPRRIKNICNRQLCMQYWNVNLQQTTHSRRILVPFPPHQHIHSDTSFCVYTIICVNTSDHGRK